MIRKKRYQEVKDVFTITCKKCNSTNVDIYTDFGLFCDIQEMYVECNDCDSKYDPLELVDDE